MVPNRRVQRQRSNPYRPVSVNMPCVLEHLIIATENPLFVRLRFPPVEIEIYDGVEFVSSMTLDLSVRTQISRHDFDQLKFELQRPPAAAAELDEFIEELLEERTAGRTFTCGHLKELCSVTKSQHVRLAIVKGIYKHISDPTSYDKYIMRLFSDECDRRETEAMFVQRRRDLSCPLQRHLPAPTMHSLRNERSRRRGQAGTTCGSLLLSFEKLDAAEVTEPGGAIEKFPNLPPTKRRTLRLEILGLRGVDAKTPILSLCLGQGAKPLITGIPPEHNVVYNADAPDNYKQTSTAPPKGGDLESEDEYESDDGESSILGAVRGGTGATQNLASLIPNHNFLSTVTLRNLELPVDPQFMPSLRISVKESGIVTDSDLGVAIIPLHSRIEYLPDHVKNPSYQPPHHYHSRASNPFLTDRTLAERGNAHHSIPLSNESGKNAEPQIYAVSPNASTGLKQISRYKKMTSHFRIPKLRSTKGNKAEAASEPKFMKDRRKLPCDLEDEMAVPFEEFLVRTHAVHAASYLADHSGGHVKCLLSFLEEEGAPLSEDTETPIFKDIMAQTPRNYEVRLFMLAGHSLLAPRVHRKQKAKGADCQPYVQIKLGGQTIANEKDEWKHRVPTDPLLERKFKVRGIICDV